MNHPKKTVRVIRLREPVRWLGRYAKRPYDDGAGYIGIRLRQPQQLKEGVLNSYTRLSPYYPWNPKIGAWGEFAGRARAWFGEERSLAHAAWQVFVSMPGLLHMMMLRFMNRFNPRITAIQLSNFVEMEPRPENRIMLTDDRDALDMPVPRVVHELSRRDLESLHRLHEQIAADLETMGCGGELIGTPEELAKAEWVDAYHYLGTTRMGTDPEHSVVNPDLRVHTVENVYVAGGSVFPTGGCANPTMTIVALSIRLAEHLRTTSAHEVNGR